MTKYFFSKALIFIILIVFSFTSCDIINNDFEPKDEFTKIFNSNETSSTFYAEDIKQTNDGSYIVLASLFSGDNTYVWHNPYLIKTDSEGNILWQNALASPYVNPVGEIIEISNEYYFFCMNETTLVSYLMKIDQTSGTTEIAATFDDITYPLKSFKTEDNSILLQGYDHLARKTIFSKINSSFSVDWTNTYSMIEDAEEKLIAHITKKDKIYPFFIGELGSDKYLFSGFYNYSFSTLFVNKTDGSVSGFINGYRYEGAIGSMVDLSGGKFAFSMYNQGENYFFPTYDISTTSTLSIENLSGKLIHRLHENANVITKNMLVNGKDVVIFAANTKNNQIAMYFYDKISGDLLGTKDISDSNPIEISNFVQTSDGGIIIVGRTYVIGQFSRVFIRKISTDNL